ncbi:helix-turn-helix transcriptional regulator, partial [Parabacteroides goldsteinii]|uniref:helix-turn-helix transcriptional regulator n=1 Tax=Parabacteroides goldsteinii TaxID=328812 RepID=UPI003F49A9F0
AAFPNEKLYISCVDSVYRLQRKNSLAETEQIYNYIKYQEENEKLYMIQHNAIVISLVILVVFIISMIFIVLKKRKKKQDLSNAEETVDTLRKMEKENLASSGCSDGEKDKMVKKALLMQLNITKVLSQLNEKSDKDQDFLEKFNRLFYGEQRANNVNWEDFYMLINLLYDGFAEKLQLTYANILNEKEIQLCCLLKANMETTEIACIMGQSINTVRTRKTQIRKNIKAPDAADIVAFIEEKLRNKG